MIRATQATTQLVRVLQGRQGLHGRDAVYALHAIEAPAAETAETAGRDWSGVREGVREVFLTISATLALGFAWAAVELGRLGAEPALATAAVVETGYDGEAWTGQ